MTNTPIHTSWSRSRLIPTYSDLPTNPSTYSHQPKPIQIDPGLASTTTVHLDQPTHPSTYSEQPKPIKTDPGLASTTTTDRDQPIYPSTY